jgi:uncharacterized membrane protein (DUF106 family)
MQGMKLMFLVMIVGLGVVFLWDNIPAIKLGVHAALDPSFGELMNWNLNLGFIFIVLIFSGITILAQKYLSDQETLKRLKEEMKLVQDEMKLYKQDPKKTSELTTKSFELTMKTMPITMRPALYTSIPFILTFRWFNDYFISNPTNVFGMNWIFAYLILTLVMTSVLKKVFEVH